MTKKIFTLVKTNYNHHVSMDLYHDFEKKMLGRSQWDIVNGLGSISARILRQFFRIIPPVRIRIRKHKNYVVIGYQKEKFFPFFHFDADMKILWMYDAWQTLFADIEKTIRAYKLDYVFTSSKQSADYLNTLNIPNFKSCWIPEGVNIDDYKFIPYQDRTTDILHLGRKWNEYHAKIKSIENHLIYKYEIHPGHIIFPNRQEFILGLADSRISICVPSNITHPNRSGYISTVTNRYFQSMASKCLILGKLPYDMIPLFNYNPIIEIDENNAIAQIQYILSNFDSYIPLIEKNYNEVKNFHSWDARLNQIEEFIANTT